MQTTLQGFNRSWNRIRAFQHKGEKGVEEGGEEEGGGEEDMLKQYLVPVL
jgi:hypothetical protein